MPSMIRGQHQEFKNPQEERRLFVSRALVASAFIMAMVFALAGRMAYLQIVSHEHFATLSLDNRVRLKALPPPRGLIFDRNGVLLADNLPNYSIEITPSQVDDLDATLARLEVLMEVDEADLRRFNSEKTRKQSFQAIPLRFNLTEDEVARFAVNQHDFPGVEIVARLGRYYPQDGLGIHALGYVGRINERELQQIDARNYNGSSHIGKLGVEKRYETLLHGAVGVQKVEINAQGRTLRVLEEQAPTPGSDLILTLDANLQRVAEEALGPESGAVVAMDPRTGEVLALASVPTYDPNLFVNGISSRDYRALRNDPGRPLFNRALTGQYPPGSTIKPFMALAGLEAGATTVDRTMYAGPYFKLPNGKRKYRDWKRGGHGEVNLHKSIVQSCDVYFYDLANRMGIDWIHGFLGRFGLGQRTALDATGEAPGLLPSRDWKRRAYGQVWFPGETVIVGIGQGYMLTTPLQLASAVSVIANRGRRVQPHLLRALRGPGGGTFEPAPVQPLEPIKLASEGYWDAVISAMVDVANTRRGTAWRIGKDAPYTIAGKTGTAQVFGLKEGEKYNVEELEKKLRDHALFIAFAPAEDPQIAVAVIVENGGHGGSAAAPVARAVMDYYLLGLTQPPGI